MKYFVLHMVTLSVVTRIKTEKLINLFIYLCTCALVKMDISEVIIENVKQHECLYNLAAKDYKNVQKKAELWEEIGGLINLPGKQEMKENVVWKYFYICTYIHIFIS